MSDKETRRCKNCGKKYTVYEVGNRWPGGKEQEDINCPWCGHLDGKMTTSGSIRTEKVRETEDKPEL